MVEMTLHMGLVNDESVIHVEWINENNIKCKDELIIKIRNNDKPRIMDVILNNVKIAEIEHHR